MSIIPYPSVAVNPLDNLLSRLSHVRNHGDYSTACCPVHKSSGKQSLSISFKEGKVLMKVWCGCSKEDILDAVGLKMGDLFAEEREPEKPSGCTLAEFAEAKKLPIDILKHYHWSDCEWFGIPAIRIPYADVNGKHTIDRYRVAMSGDKFRWQKGAHPHLFGLWRMKSYTSGVVIVEGESDAMTLWNAGYAAIGLPGADIWQEEWSQYFKGIEQIFVCVEPDAGGQAVIKWLSQSEIKSRVLLFTLGSFFKDSSGLYTSNPEEFRKNYATYLNEAKPYDEYFADLLKYIRLTPLRECHKGVPGVVYVEAEDA